MSFKAKSWIVRYNDPRNIYTKKISRRIQKMFFYWDQWESLRKQYPKIKNIQTLTTYKRWKSSMKGLNSAICQYEDFEEKLFIARKRKSFKKNRAYKKTK